MWGFKSGDNCGLARATDFRNDRLFPEVSPMISGNFVLKSCLTAVSDNQLKCPAGF